MAEHSIPPAGEVMNAKVIFVLFLLVAASTGAQAQWELRFSGYAADIAAYQISSVEGVDNAFVNLTRLRLRPVYELWEDAGIVLEHEVDLLLSSRDRRMPIKPPHIGNRQAVDLRWEIVDDGNAGMEHYVDRLYFRQNLSWGSIVAGRQRIQWGTGRVWNPTDLFNPINPASYDKIEKDGADALSLKLHLGQFTDAHLVYNLRPALDSSNYGARFRTNYAEYDFSIMGGYFDKRVVLGGDVAGNLLDAGVRAELVWVGASEKGYDEYLRYVVGADYQLTPELYLLFEYLFNGEGVNNPGHYDLLGLYRGEILQLNRKYLYLGAVYQLHPLIVGNAGFNINSNDGSGFLLLNATYSSSENTSLIGGLFLPLGEKFDEYWYYPTSLYLRGEWHF
jgi:hypothetical protein